MNHVNTNPNLRFTRCPQCGSDGCGPLRCRFSLMSHERYRERLAQAANTPYTANVISAIHRPRNDK